MDEDPQEGGRTQSEDPGHHGGLTASGEVITVGTRSVDNESKNTRASRKGSPAPYRPERFRLRPRKAPHAQVRRPTGRDMAAFFQDLHKEPRVRKRRRKGSPAPYWPELSWPVDSVSAARTSRKGSPAPYRPERAGKRVGTRVRKRRRKGSPAPYRPEPDLLAQAGGPAQVAMAVRRPTGRKRGCPDVGSLRAVVAKAFRRPTCRNESSPSWIDPWTTSQGAFRRPTCRNFAGDLFRCAPWVARAFRRPTRKVATAQGQPGVLEPGQLRALAEPSRRLGSREQKSIRMVGLAYGARRKGSPALLSRNGAR